MAGVRPGAVAHQIEIDLVLCCGNNVGIVEATTGVYKAGIDQLGTAGNSSYLGRYSTKILGTGRCLPRAHKSLAMAQGIHLVELPGYTVHLGTPEQEQLRRLQCVRMALAGRLRSCPKLSIGKGRAACGQRPSTDVDALVPVGQLEQGTRLAQP